MKQVHINMGFTLMTATALGIDSVPMEGLDLAALDKEFGLTEKGYKAVAIISQSRRFQRRIAEIAFRTRGDLYQSLSL